MEGRRLVQAQSFSTPQSASDEPMSVCQRRRKLFCSRIRKVNSKGAVLIIIWSFLVMTAYYSSTDLSTFHFSPKHNHDHSLAVIMALFTVAVACPIAGWLADVLLGRYRVILGGLWIMWFGSAGCSIIQLLAIEDHKLYYALVVSMLVLSVGFAAFSANALPFAVDQMLTASGDGLSAFICWNIWTTCVGMTIAKIKHIGKNCLDNTPWQKTDQESSIYSCYWSLYSVGMISAALVCNYLLRHWMTIEPQSQNPLKTVFGVLRYAAKHKHPVNRSALTYCGEHTPSRIDFAKDRYGGPYTTEQVEDVKTCVQVIPVILSFMAVWVSILLSQDGVPTRNKTSIQYSTCQESIINVLYSYQFVIVLLIPLHEFIIIPLASNLMPSSLKRVGLALLAAIVTSVLLVIVSAFENKADFSCLFLSNASNASYPINYYSFTVPSQALIAVATLLSWHAQQQFLCAQSPYNMKGLIIGLGVAVTFFTLAISHLIVWVWEHGIPEQFQHKLKPSCDFWYYVTTIIVEIVSLLFLCLVAYCYKWRERDEPQYNRQAVENYFEHHDSDTRTYDAVSNTAEIN